MHAWTSWARVEEEEPHQGRQYGHWEPGCGMTPIQSCSGGQRVLLPLLWAESRLPLACTALYFSAPEP